MSGWDGTGRDGTGRREGTGRVPSHPVLFRPFGRRASPPVPSRPLPSRPASSRPVPFAVTPGPVLSRPVVPLAAVHGVREKANAGASARVECGKACSTIVGELAFPHESVPTLRAPKRNGVLVCESDLGSSLGPLWDCTASRILSQAWGLCGTGLAGAVGTRRVGTGRDGTGRDGTRREGTGRDGTGRDGTGRVPFCSVPSRPVPLAVVRPVPSRPIPSRWASRWRVEQGRFKQGDRLPLEVLRAKARAVRLWVMNFGLCARVSGRKRCPDSGPQNWTAVIFYVIRGAGKRAPFLSNF